MVGQIRKQISLPQTPYIYSNPKFGQTFYMAIRGLIPTDSGENVAINFCTHNDSQFPNINIPFHLSIRPSIPELVRNTYFAEKNAWGEIEEKQLMCDTFPIEIDSLFEMSLLCKPNEVECTLNEKVIFKFEHKQDRKQINFIEIHGNIDIESIAFDFIGD